MLNDLSSNMILPAAKQTMHHNQSQELNNDSSAYPINQTSHVSILNVETEDQTMSPNNKSRNHPNYSTYDTEKRKNNSVVASGKLNKYTNSSTEDLYIANKGVGAFVQSPMDNKILHSKKKSLPNHYHVGVQARKGSSVLSPTIFSTTSVQKVDDPTVFPKLHHK